MKIASLLILATLVTDVAILAAAPPSASETETPIREIFVPFEDLNVLLESNTNHVFLTRQQYNELRQRAKQSPQTETPTAATVLSAKYEAVVETGRVVIDAKIEIDVLRAGLQVVPLPLQQVGMLQATLDGKPAALGKSDDGRASLFVEGIGRHTLSLQLVASVKSSSTQQTFTIGLPTPPSTSFQLAGPGEVQMAEQSQVIRQDYDAQRDRSTIQLLLKPGINTLAMGIGNHQLRQQSVLVARSVLVAEVTESYERLHATVSMEVLHGAATEFRFAMPTGFEVTHVDSPLISKFEVVQEEGRDILIVSMRQPARDTEVFNITAEKSGGQTFDPDGSSWTAPQLIPLDIAGVATVVGVLLDGRLDLQSLQPTGLIPIDTAVITSAIPTSVFDAEPGAPTIRPVAAYYAAQGEYALQADFRRPPAEIGASTHMLLTLSQQSHAVRGQFSLTPTQEKLFQIRFRVPAQWHLTQITDGQQKPLEFETLAAEDATSPAVVRVRLPRGIAPGDRSEVQFQAIHTPDQWLDNWDATSVAFPDFGLLDASPSIGAIAVLAIDDMLVQSDSLTNLTPLDDQQKADFGLQEVVSDLAFEFDQPQWSAKLTVQRKQPDLTAESFTFFRIQPDGIFTHSEIVYDVTDAGARTLSFLLPSDAPTTLNIRGAGGAVVKEFSSEEVDEGRLWTARLASATIGSCRLLIDFEARLDDQESTDRALPIPRATNVRFQTALVAVEGHGELDVQVDAGDARPVDVGKLAGADYRVGSRLLGAFGFLGEPGAVNVAVFRRPGYGLPPVIVQRAELVTLIGTHGSSQTAARYQLRTKASFLEVLLPTGSTLWSVRVDGSSAKPQKQGDSLLVGLPEADARSMRDLQVVYATPIAATGAYGRFQSSAPRLYLRDDAGARAGEVPVADLKWHLELPAGYVVTDEAGTVHSGSPSGQPLPIRNVFTLLSLPTMPTVSAAPTTNMAAVNDTAETEAFGFERAADAGMEMGMEMPMQMGMDEAKQSIEPGKRMMNSGGMAYEDGNRKSGSKSGEGRADVAAGVGDKRIASAWSLEGVGSLQIDVDRQTTGQRVTFTSLGTDARVDATVVDSHRIYLLGIATMILVGLIGLLLTGRGVSVQALFVLGVLFFANLVPVACGLELELAWPATMACLTGLLLILYYVGVAIFRWGRTVVRGPVLASVLIWMAVCGTTFAQPATPPAAAPGKPNASLPEAIDLERLSQWLSDDRPIDLPADAVIVPYQADGGTDAFREAEKLLVPYETYVQLWNQAYPEEAIDKPVATAPFALAGANYQATLAGTGFLVLQGQIVIELFSDEAVTIPLPIEGVVFEQASLDGKPAPLRLIASAMEPGDKNAPAAQRAVPAANPIGVDPRRAVMGLEVKGEGRHSFEFAIRMVLHRTGGWRVAAGTIPLATAAQLELTAPQAGTEIRLTGVNDREHFETDADDQQIVVGPDNSGRIAIQWRPQVAQAEVDESLTAQSSAVVDVQEDGLRVVWQVAFSFPRSRRSVLSLELPDGFQIQGVRGENVRDWSVVPQADRQQLDVQLLKEATGQERLTVVLAQRSGNGESSWQVNAPAVGVVNAALHTGIVQIRRSPLLDVVAGPTAGVTRTDLATDEMATLLKVADYEESPLGIQPFQAYRFATTPFTLPLTASPIQAHGSADLQTILRITERRAEVEARIELEVHDRPVYQVRVQLPNAFIIDDVSAPCDYQWSTTTEASDPQYRLLSIFLAEGMRGKFAVVIQGSAARKGPTENVPLPSIQVLDVQRQQGEIAVQIDPAYSAVAAQLQQCSIALRGSVSRWLQTQQRSVTSLAVAYRDRTYSGLIRVTPQVAQVKGRTFTNVRVTQRAIEELIVIALDVSNAGIREFSFLLPQHLADATIQQPSLRRKTISAVDGRPDLVRVTLQLQDDLLGQIRTLVRKSRLLDSGPQTVPIPALETGQTVGRFVTLENEGRDEVVIDEPIGLEPLGRLHSQRRVLAEVLGGSLGDAFVVNESADQTTLGYRTHQRAEVRTAGASIGKAETVLIVDAAGGYRASVEYRINNDTEQFLEIELPNDAQLWTASVAGEPVKPTLVPGAASRQNVRIPLVKTAEGDTDYGVLLKYGGVIQMGGVRSRVDFPLVHTTNINVEISQVRLLLPKSHRWYGFAGTMQQARNEGDYRALDLKHLNQQFRLLSSALSSSNEYSKVRAETNLKKLGKIAQAHQDEYAHFYNDSESVRQELNLNTITQQQAAEQVTENRRKANEMLSVGNSGQLESYFDNGSNARSRRVVDRLGEAGNFAAQGPGEGKPSQKAEPRQTFNQQWLLQNGLAGEPNQPKQEAAKKSKDRRLVESLSKKNAEVRGGEAQAITPTLRFGDALQVPQVQQAPDRRGARDDVDRYSRQLQAEQSVEREFRSSTRSAAPISGGVQSNRFRVPNAMPEADPFGGPGDYSGTRSDPFASGMGSGGMGGGIPPVAPMEVQSDRQSQLDRLELFDSEAEGLQARSQAIAGNVYLASLEADLPLERGGQEFFFSAPRGEIEITAKAVPAAVLLRSTRLIVMGLMFIGFVVGWIVLRRHQAGKRAAAAC